MIRGKNVNGLFGTRAVHSPPTIGGQVYDQWCIAQIFLAEEQLSKDYDENDNFFPLTRKGNPVQGDQIGRFFAHWVIFCFGQLHENYRRSQGCKMVYFQTKNPNLGNFLRVFQRKMLVFFYEHLVYFATIWYTLWTFGIVCGNLVYFSTFWYVVPRKIWQPWTQPTFFVHFIQWLEL
jgi:hypothetical protein